MHALKYFLRNKSQISTHFIINKFKDTLPIIPQINIEDKTKSLANALSYYEKLIGISEVKLSQQEVLKAEDQFLDAIALRKLKAKDLFKFQSDIVAIRNELDKLSRGDEKYLNLITQEHNALKQLSQAQSVYKNLEENERLLFQRLSTSLRKSHEMERVQSERTKYLSLIGSIIGILLGFLCSTINNNMKMKQFKTLLLEKDKINEGLATSAPITRQNMIQNDIFNNKDSVEDLQSLIKEQNLIMENFLSKLKIILSLDVIQELNEKKTKSLSNNQSQSFYKKLSHFIFPPIVLNSDIKNLSFWDKVFHQTTLLTSVDTSNLNVDKVIEDEEIPNLLKSNQTKLEQDMKSIVNRLASSKKFASEIFKLNFVNADDLSTYYNSLQSGDEVNTKLQALGKTIFAYSLFAILFPIAYSYINT